MIYILIERFDLTNLISFDHLASESFESQWKHFSFSFFNDLSLIGARGWWKKERVRLRARFIHSLPSLPPPPWLGLSLSFLFKPNVTISHHSYHNKQSVDVVAFEPLIATWNLLKRRFSDVEFLENKAHFWWHIRFV